MPAFAPRLPSYAAPAVSDPTAGIYSLLLNPQMNTMEVDTSAAEAAIAGGFGGSQFGANNMARLRDSERIAREVQGQQLLQPYLERASREGLTRQEISARERLADKQNQFELGKIGAQTQAQRELAELEQAGALERLGVETANRTALEQLQQGGEMARLGRELESREGTVQAQIAADSARLAIEQAGLSERLTSEQQTQLQRALLEGDQRMQQLILSEAGASGRQREQIGAQLQIAQAEARNNLLRTILPFALGTSGGRGGGAEGLGDPRSRVAPIGTHNISTGGGAGGSFDWVSQRWVPDPPRTSTVGSGGVGANGNILSRVDEVLRRYGLQ